MGLPVHANPRPEYLTQLKKLIHVVERLPETSFYRQSTLALAKQRMSVVESTEEVSEIEQKIAGGQMEELMVQVADEIKLARSMAEWKSWEGAVEQPPAGQWEYFERK